MFDEVQPRPGFKRAESGIKARFAVYFGFGVYRPGENSSTAAKNNTDTHRMRNAQ